MAVMGRVVGTMTAFVAGLRHRIEAAGQAVHRRSARLLDLLDRAAATDVDTPGWVPASVGAAAAGTCA